MLLCSFDCDFSCVTLHYNTMFIKISMKLHYIVTSSNITETSYFTLCYNVISIMICSTLCHNLTIIIIIHFPLFYAISIMSHYNLIFLVCSVNPLIFNVIFVT